MSRRGFAGTMSVVVAGKCMPRTDQTVSALPANGAAVEAATKDWAEPFSRQSPIFFRGLSSQTASSSRQRRQFSEVHLSWGRLV